MMGGAWVDGAPCMPAWKIHEGCMVHERIVHACMKGFMLEREIHG